MALLFADPFDHYNTAAMATMWDIAGGTISAGNGRNGTQSLRDPSQPFLYFPNVGDNTCIVGGWFKFRTAFLANNFLFEISRFGTADGARQCWLRVNNDGTLSVVTGTGTTTSTFALSLATEYFIELKAFISPTVGTVEVRVTAIATGAVGTVINITGQNTQNSGNTGWDGVRITSAGNTDFDDVHVCDGTGTLNNDFLGDTIKEALYGKTDAVAAGFNAGLTPSTGTDHGALVDEHPSDGDTSYNSAATAGLKDTYRLDAMTSTGAVLGVIAVLSAKKTDLITKQIYPVLRSVGVDYDGDAHDTYTAYEYVKEVQETDPATGLPWVAAAVNAVELGMKVVA